MTNSEIKPRNLSVDQACTYLAMGRSTLYDLMKRGEAPEGLKVGRKRLFPVQQLDDWMQQLQGQQVAH